MKKWLQQGKTVCASCRKRFPDDYADKARVDTSIVSAIRLVRSGGGSSKPSSPSKPAPRRPLEDRPLEAFCSERAVRPGRANASSGKILVRTPPAFFGAIPPEFGHVGRGLEVGDAWASRLDCRQYGAHLPHVSAVAGQVDRGAQSIVLSGKFGDDIDLGEVFIYSGGGGFDLTGEL